VFAVSIYRALVRIASPASFQASEKSQQLVSARRFPASLCDLRSKFGGFLHFSPANPCHQVMKNQSVRFSADEPIRSHGIFKAAKRACAKIWPLPTARLPIQAEGKPEHQTQIIRWPL
jgi:hypothetical protein